MKKIVALVCAALVLGAMAVALPAGAQDSQTEQVTVYDKWDDHLVPGDLVVPVGSLVSGKGRTAKPNTLIKVRTHFVPEILKSVEKL